MHKGKHLPGELIRGDFKCPCGRWCVVGHRDGVDKAGFWTEEGIVCRYCAQELRVI